MTTKTIKDWKKAVKSESMEGWPNNATRMFHNWMLRDESGYDWSDIARTANSINKHRLYHTKPSDKKRRDYGLEFFVDCIDDAIEYMENWKHASGVDMLDHAVRDFLWEVDSPSIARYWMEGSVGFSGKGS